MKLNKKNILMVISVLVTISLIIGAKYFYEICYKNYYLTVTGIVEYADGIGRQIIDFENLVGDDVEMNTTATIRKQEYIPERFQKILNIRNKKKGYVVLYEYSFPFSFTSDSDVENYIFQSNKYKRKTKFNNIPREEQIYITYSMFESDRIANFWVYEINRNWDMVVVPDENLVDVYKNSGVTKPIFVVPLGTNLESHLQAPLKTKANKFFTFANLTSFEERKNILKLVQAYNKAFKDKNDVRLLLSPRRDGGSYESIMDYILESNVAGVTVDMGTKDNNYYNFLFSSIDCYVSPSKGEGFSVIPREAMARGIPVIISDILSQKTLVETGLVKSVEPVNRVPGFYNKNMIVGDFEDISVLDLADAMLDVYNDYQKYLDKSAKARTWVERGQYKYLKDEYLNMVKPKKIILSDRNEITKEHLMTDSKELYNKWKHLQDIGALN